MNLLLKSIIFVCLFQTCSFRLAFDLEKEWSKYKERYELEFSQEEDTLRKNIFQENLDYINEHNQKKLGYFLRMNQFGHLTIDEVSEYFEKVQIDSIEDNPPPKFEIVKDIKERDWRNEGAVNKPRKLGRCNAAYSFSSNAVMEGMHKIKHGQLYDLSPQQIVDCTGKKTKFGNLGCYGGWVSNSFQYGTEFGMMTEGDYPFKDYEGTCKQSESKVKVKVSSHNWKYNVNETELAYYISQTGIVAHYVCSTDKSFIYYGGGIFDDPRCCKLFIHSMAFVGVGNYPEYYITKNSWGTDWGEGGFMRIVRNKNMCGIANVAYFCQVV